MQLLDFPLFLALVALTANTVTAQVDGPKTKNRLSFAQDVERCAQSWGMDNTAFDSCCSEAAKNHKRYLGGLKKDNCLEVRIK
jgi:hypothetical protein